MSTALHGVTQEQPHLWHLLQVSDVLDMEFASALAERVPLMAWEPSRSYFPWLRSAHLSTREVADPKLLLHRFPVLRGYARFPLSAVARTGPGIRHRLTRVTPHPANSVLVCTIPYMAPVAELWPGPVVYWLTDLMESYAGADAATVHSLDKRLCEVATLVCPNSNRIAAYLQSVANCGANKISVTPNATRSSNLLAVPSRSPHPLPSDLADLPRPVIGVIGNLAGNMDWLFLEELVRSTPSMHWAFVGPTTMAIQDAKQAAARAHVMSLPNARFVGAKPYGLLASYARAFDAAVLPYRRCEPTYSGSSTRFYEHLAAGRPMIATRGFEELLHKEPLLRLVDQPEEAASVLREWQSAGFDDGFAEQRWRASQDGTWQARAASVEREVLHRVSKCGKQADVSCEGIAG